ncbi:hypothetical protein E9840_11905 [Tissierella creatinini]|nr:hypothetical protein E9840_11905 [Tissierella creatinini]TJX59970.1 hypothetical protein E8P77_20780 [Soehngenia saccharolytica]
MITFFNRKEIYVCQTNERFIEIRNILRDNNIKYTYRIVDRNSSQGFGSQRGRTGTFGHNMRISKTYYIYVNKKDYEVASSLIGRWSGF